MVDDVLGGVIRMSKLTDLAGKASFAMTLTATPENRQAVILVYTSV